MALRASEAQLEEFDLIGRPFNLLAVEAHMHGITQVEAHGRHDDEHPVLLAQLPELQPIDQRLITADAGDVDHIHGLDLIGLDGLDERLQARPLLPAFRAANAEVAPLDDDLVLPVAIRRGLLA
jgi:hypothetical protein